MIFRLQQRLRGRDNAGRHRGKLDFMCKCEESSSGMSLKRLLGLADYQLHSRLSAKLNPWGFAMNGMTSRLEATRQIIHTLKIEHIVETGTFRGTTAEWFAQFGIPFETVEVFERYAAFSQARLSPFRNASVFVGSSVAHLRKRGASTIPRHARHFFYLDAHWQDHLSLREELEIIFFGYDQAVVLIDDFEVKGDAGYGYDRYSQEESLTLDYVLTSNLPCLWYFSPITPSGQETGIKRGWIVLTNSADLALQLDSISLLRSHGQLQGTTP